jgi:heterodisulfide reductase subunit C
MAEPLAPIQEMVRACIQCGTCSASCPNAFAMDLTPRKLWRLVLMGQSETIFQSQTFYLCSSCYTCTLRCPRGLPLTEAMDKLKAIAGRQNLAPYRRSARFYGQFLNSVRRHGRVREMEFMTLYFLAMKDPRLPFSYASLGLKLMGKGKTTLQLPSKGEGKLEKLFEAVAMQENLPGRD